MGDQWLTNNLTAHIEKYVLDNIDNVVIIRYFQNMKRPKLQL